MKKLMALILLGLFSISFAGAQDIDLPEYMIEREVSVKELADLEVRTNSLREEFKHESSLMQDTTDLIEGKIQAAMIDSIMRSLNKAQSLMDSIQSDSDLTREAIDSIKKELDVAEALIKELNV